MIDILSDRFERKIAVSKIKDRIKKINVFELRQRDLKKELRKREPWKWNPNKNCSIEALAKSRWI